MIKQKNIIALIIIIFFIVSFLIPILTLFKMGFVNDGFTLEYLTATFNDAAFQNAMLASIFTSLATAIISLTLSLILVVFMKYTRINKLVKKIVEFLILLPMLLPSISFGFALIYLFGNNGLLMNVFNTSIIDVYDYQGVILGLVIYTIGPTYLMVNNSFNYLNGNLYYVSDILRNKKLDIMKSVIFPAIKSGLISSFFIAFTLSFTDYGIPMSLNYNTASKYLYNITLGSYPNFSQGSIVAIFLLIVPLIIYIFVEIFIKKENSGEEITPLPVKKSLTRDIVTSFLTLCWLNVIIGMFAIIIIVPFVTSWPYDLSFSFDSWLRVLQKENVGRIIFNTARLALLTVIFGTILTFLSAYLVTKTNSKLNKIIDTLSIIPNIIPGMTLGLAYLLIAKNFDESSTIIFLVLINVVYFFTSPYLLFKNALERLNPNLEKTSIVFGYSWFKTLVKVIIPNLKNTLKEVVCYLIIHSFTTISAIVFISSIATETLSLTIKRLEYFADFRGIFTMSLVILVINIIVVTFRDIKLKKITNK